MKIAFALETADYSSDGFRAFRSKLADACHAQVAALNGELASVRLKRRYVEKYKRREAFDRIGEGDKAELIAHIAPLVFADDEDEFARRFDNFMYGLMLSAMEKKAHFSQYKRELVALAAELEKRAAVPQIGEKLEAIRCVKADEFWREGNILNFEAARQELRALIKFLDDGGEGRKSVVTRLTDPVLERSEGIIRA